MQIYLDESSDGGGKLLLLGALFIPQFHTTYLYNEIDSIKRKNGFYKLKKELKYTECIDPVSFNTAKDVIDLFLKSTSFFRLVFLNKDDIDKKKFGYGKDTENETLIFARVYKKFSELLISQPLNCIHHGVLLCDELEIGASDEFVEVMKHAYTKATNFHGVCVPTLGVIQKIKSDDRSHPMTAMADLLIGCVLNANTQVSNQYKNGLREYLVARLLELYGVTDLTSKYWGTFSEYFQYYESKILKRNPKFNICFWKPTKKDLD